MPRRSVACARLACVHSELTPAPDQEADAEEHSLKLLDLAGSMLRWSVESNDSRPDDAEETTNLAKECQLLVEKH